MPICVHMSNHKSQFMHLVKMITCVHPGQAGGAPVYVTARHCTEGSSAVSLFQAQDIRKQVSKYKSSSDGASTAKKRQAVTRETKVKITEGSEAKKMTDVAHLKYEHHRLLTGHPKV